MTRFGLAVHHTFHALRSRNFRLFFFGQVVSVTGTWMNFTASAWLVLRLTGSGFAVGVNTALMFLPILLIGPLGGSLADRLDKRRILVVTQAAFAAVALSVYGILVADVARLWMVFALSLAAGIVTAIDNPTRQSFYMEMVGDKDVTNAVSLNSAAFTGARIVGPAVAGILIATVGTAVCFLVDGVSYLAVIGALLAMRPGDMHLRENAARRSSVLEGFRYVWRKPELRRPLMLMTVVFTLGFNFSILLPLLAKRTFDGGAETFGALSALTGLGSFIGALAMANRSGSGAAPPTLRRLAALSTAAGCTLLLVAVVPTLDSAYVAMVPLGISIMVFVVTANSMLQLGSAPQLRGRVMALYGMVFLGSTPIGALVSGWVGERFEPRAGFELGGVAALGAGIWALWWSSRDAARSPALDERQTEAA